MTWKMKKLDAAKLRDYVPTPEEVASIPRKPLYIIIDNVLDTFNTGSMFRLADAIGCSGIYLVGNTDSPDDPKVGHKIHKSSVGTWKWLNWRHTDTVEQAVQHINVVARLVEDKAKRETMRVQTVAIEQSKTSVPYDTFDYNLPLTLIVGHETTGVSEEGLAQADATVELPMYGVNKSLNVMASLAIVLWHVSSSLSK